jgi:hypothetical protein
VIALVTEELVMRSGRLVMLSSPDIMAIMRSDTLEGGAGNERNPISVVQADTGFQDVLGTQADDQAATGVKLHGGIQIVIGEGVIPPFIDVGIERPEGVTPGRQDRGIEQGSFFGRQLVALLRASEKSL